MMKSEKPLRMHQMMLVVVLIQMIQMNVGRNLRERIIKLREALKSLKIRNLLPQLQELQDLLWQNLYSGNIILIHYSI